MEKKKLQIKDARAKLLQAELDARISNEELVEKALKAVQDDGIIFLDEIDKICSPKGSYGPDASSEGVQRDLLPIIEGTTIPTKYGPVKSDHVLFVCAGAFHAVKPSDMLAELQGRLPIKMMLHPLTEGDFYRILTEPEFGLLKQNVALMATEGVEVVWTDCGRQEIARMATEMNTYIENIGARRLHTVIEKITDELSFHAADYKGMKVEIDQAFVAKKMADVEIDKTARGLL
jgi:ATP-dependent HslUV protease ATP-binding subunit HslU